MMSIMSEHYLSDFHRKYSEASEAAVERMSQHPYSFEQKKAQAERIRQEAESRKA